MPHPPPCSGRGGRRFKSCHSDQLSLHQKSSRGTIWGTIPGLHPVWLTPAYRALRKHRAAIDSKYGVCFRVFLSLVTRILDYHEPNETVDLVIEDGHANGGAGQVIFAGTEKIALRCSFDGPIAIVQSANVQRVKRVTIHILADALAVFKTSLLFAVTRRNKAYLSWALGVRAVSLGTNGIRTMTTPFFHPKRSSTE